MSGEIGVARRDLAEEGWGKMHFVKRFAAFACAVDLDGVFGQVVIG